MRAAEPSPSSGNSPASRLAVTEAMPRPAAAARDAPSGSAAGGSASAVPTGR
jgi:hypothetical protein